MLAQVRNLRTSTGSGRNQMADRSGQRVTILGGMQEFIGKTGTILWQEGAGFYRVRLDEPVEIDGIGVVGDDLWEGALLRRIGVR